MSTNDVVIKPVTDNISIAGQVSAAQIARLNELGFRAVLNLRSPQEEGSLSDEQTQVEALGLPYVNLPINPQSLNKKLIDEAVGQVNALPKPLLIHCGSALRAAFIVMMYRVIYEGLSLEEAKAESTSLGFDLDQKPPLKAAIENYFTAQA